MPVYIGVDLHTRRQRLSWCDTSGGETGEQELSHGGEEVRRFYAGLEHAVVGVETVGYAVWFHRLMEELGHELWVGDAYQIRRMARRRQKNDQRDAALILDLLLRGDFPRVHVPCPASRQVLALLRYRHRLVKIQTMLKNGLQGVALSHGLRLGARLWTEKGQQQLQRLPLDASDASQRVHSLALLDLLEQRIAAIAQKLEQEAASDERVVRLRTHPGVGLLTAMATVHTLEPVSRFRRARYVAAYCGFDPCEDSSGERQRWGHISKQGNLLLRFLLTEAAHVAVRRDDELMAFHHRLLGRKHPAVAITAAARKLVLRLYAMLRDQVDYAEFRRRGRDARRARESHRPAASRA